MHPRFTAGHSGGQVAAGDCPPGDLPAGVAGHRERSPGNLLSLELDPLLFPTSPSLLWLGGSPWVRILLDCG